LETSRDPGVNRLSPGAQSFDHPLPALNGHPAGDALIRRPGMDRRPPRFHDPQYRDGRSAWN